MTAARSSEPRWMRLSPLWLLLLIPSLVLSNGRWQLAAAALAAIVLSRLFINSQPAGRALLVLLALQVIANWVMWWQVIPAPGALYYIIAAAYGLCYLAPFVADRLLAPRIQGFASTLVLPLSWYVTEILIHRFTPYGSWSSVGYTQMGHGLLTPLAAWGGVAAVSFATVWIGSVLAWLVMSRVAARQRATAAAAFAVGLTATLWLASLPFASDPANGDVVQVAAITPTHEGTLELDRSVQKIRQSGRLDAAALAHIDDLSETLNGDLLRRSRAAALAGAEIVIWSETAAHVLASREAQFIERGQAIAVEHQVYLFMAMGVWHPGSQPPLENKVIAITPAGEVALDYGKARPIVGSEAPFLPPGHDTLGVLDAPFGRLGLVICHDADFPDFVAQAGRNAVDLLIVPSADWAAIADLHAKMGVMRAVENGVWLLRPAYQGLTVFATPSGSVVNSAYDDGLAERVLIGSVRGNGAVRTLFPHVGHSVTVAALLALVVLVWVALFRR